MSSGTRWLPGGLIPQRYGKFVAGSGGGIIKQWRIAIRNLQAAAAGVCFQTVADSAEIIDKEFICINHPWDIIVCCVCQNNVARMEVLDSANSLSYYLITIIYPSRIKT
ncbi:MAG: hypothetical protein CVU40_14210 [Chloroflexi bacterium HGW-Chloroflexi-2]|nr:MAG: hypothetical protein CVU40_14210 [Chloroflexi bacterium HGW-Chloroflexi-2]